MKKLFFPFLFAASLITFSFVAPADFEGKVTYEVSVEGGNMPPEAMAMFAGSELSVYIKGTRSRSDITMGFQNTTTISDSKTGASVSLMEVMGNKYQIKSEPQKDEKAPDVKVKYLDDTKEIAGYKCKKAEMTYKSETGEQMVSSVWYTEEISNYMGNDKRSSQFKGLKGMPLEYEMNMERGMKMKMIAKTVSKEPVPDSKFEIPSGYKETTVEEMQKDMMKMMQGGGQ